MIHTAIALIVLPVLLISCHDEEWQGASGTQEGYVALYFNADIPAMQEVITRSVDPDGGGVQNMTLFCFDNYGLFITTVTAKTSSTSDLTGKFSAQVPENTQTIHFLANQNMTEFKEDDFRNKSEAEVMATLEGSSGRMIYWARFACDPANKNDKIDKQMMAKGNTIQMIRNHAQVSIQNPQNEWIEVTGFATYNTNAFGTVAPYHPEKGFDFVWPSNDSPFVTLPLNNAKMSDITDVTTAMRQYIFECENNADDPVSVIIRGHRPDESANNDLYYRVMLIDDQGEQVLLRRNHHYKLNITGKLSYGQATFAEALEAAATNDVWISIDDDVNEVEDQNYILTVEKTNHVLDESKTNKTYTLSYTLKGKNKNLQTSDAPEVSWIDNHVARMDITNKFNIVDGVGQGEIQISLLSLGTNEKLEGTLLVKKGRLQRKIKVITIKQQSFVPTWVSTQVYGIIDETNPTQNRPHVTAMFTIPESCPTELFPMRVLISVNHLDIRYASGMVLPVIKEGDPAYGKPNDIGFKYVYTAEKAGVQRIYFENILSQSPGTENDLLIEADYFEDMKQVFSFSNNRNSITITGLKAYNPDGGGSEEFAEDELILYRLVPQKRNANVQFDLQLREKPNDELENAQQGLPFNADAKDEFLLYSQYLNYYLNGDEGKAGVKEFDCTFYPDESDKWWQANNPNGGRMLMFKPNHPDKPAETGKYSIYMYTNRAKSAEVIRIASNQPDYPAILEKDAGSGGIYNGNSYRSVTFELANYNPFRFAARVNEVGNDATGTTEEPITSLEWSYNPDQPIDIEIDVTSFQGSDGQSADPFGEEFEIYIDAPMLRIDADRLAACNLNAEKLKADPTVPGRFIYTVAADRSQERSFGSGKEVINRDLTSGGVDQNGERKRLPFLTNAIVSAGNIRISSNEEKVVFFTKTFRVTNKSITGSLKYQDERGLEHDMPQDAFVSFERVRNNSRIGSVTVPRNGYYELRLRKEYEFNWYADAVELHYEDNDGNIYHAIYPSLAELSKNNDIILEPAADN